MISGGSALAETAPSADDAAAVLRVFRDSQRLAQREEVRQIALASKFASFHEVDDWEAAASSIDDAGPGQERVLLLGGDGSPWVSEFCVADFAAATGRSTASARAFLGTSMALVHRLPRTWARVRAGGVDGWRARRVAEATLTLSREAADWVDAEVAHRVHKVGVRTLDQLVAEAIARFDPERLAAEEEADLDRRGVQLLLPATGRAVVADLRTCLDLPDALDLDRVLDEMADQLLEIEGFLDSKEVRRARALGMLARGEFAGSPRKVELQVRVSEGDTVATVHSLTGQHLGMVSVPQIQEWCRGSRVVVRPVIDLAHEATSTGRFASATLGAQVRITARTCCFPYCEKPAEACDLDHIDAWDDQGPDNQTRSSNLAPLCRFHHRVKTFTAWRYHQGLPGLYYWTSPTGAVYVVSREGTEARPTSPPRARGSGP